MRWPWERYRDQKAERQHSREALRRAREDCIEAERIARQIQRGTAERAQTAKAKREVIERNHFGDLFEKAMREGTR